jgi:hypothetical protein
MRFRAKRGTHLCSRLGARAFFYKRPVSLFCARFFPFQPTTTTTAGWVEWFSYLKFFGEDHHLDDVACCSQVRDEKRLTLLLFPLLSSQQATNPICSKPPTARS